MSGYHPCLSTWSHGQPHRIRQMEDQVMKETPIGYKLKQSLHLQASVFLGPTQGKQTRQNIPRMFSGNTGTVQHRGFVWWAFQSRDGKSVSTSEPDPVIGRGRSEGCAGEDSGVRSRSRGKCSNWLTMWMEGEIVAPKPHWRSSAGQERRKSEECAEKLKLVKEK